jgi:hypothetical protein
VQPPAEPTPKLFTRGQQLHCRQDVEGCSGISCILCASLGACHDAVSRGMHCAGHIPAKLPPAPPPPTQGNLAEKPSSAPLPSNVLPSEGDEMQVLQELMPPTCAAVHCNSCAPSAMLSSPGGCRRSRVLCTPIILTGVL